MIAHTALTGHPVLGCSIETVNHTTNGEDISDIRTGILHGQYMQCEEDIRYAAGQLGIGGMDQCLGGEPPL